MKILITGGAGFIGSNFIEYLLNKYPNYHVLCVDKLTYAGNINNLDGVINKPNFEFIKADICDREAIFKIIESSMPDIVINFAAESHVDRSIENPEVFLKSNFIGVGVLLDACVRFNIRFHQISTDEVYGDLPYDEVDIKFNESSPLKPSSPYSASKASADMLTLSYFRTYGLPVTISRCVNNFGKNQFTEKLIPLMVMNAKNNKPMGVYGDGKNVREWIYVNDHSRALDLIIHKGKMGEIYNVGSKNSISNTELVELLCEMTNKPKRLICHIEDRKGHDRRYATDCSKIKKELGWEEEANFISSLKTTVNWYLK